MKIGYVGLGVMGYPMAGHLMKAGHEVTVYNRTVDKAQGWVEEYDGQSAATPAGAATGADMVCLFARMQAITPDKSTN